MTEDNKAKMRELIEKEGWKRYGQIEPKPSVLLWNKEVEILYEDMDGQPCKCRAIYVHESLKPNYFRAIDGDAKGNRMRGVFAYREVK